jgi:tetratricopeptide (TPR) repeat protein
MNDLAVAYHEAGDIDKSLPLKEETLRLKKARFGPNHPATLNSMNSLAAGYQEAGKVDVALPLFEETVQRMKAQLGPDHPTTLVTMHNLANCYQDAEKLDLAVPLHEETLRRMRVRLGPDHLYTLRTMNGLANGYQDSGKLALALPLFKERFERMRAKFGPGNSETVMSMSNLAVCYWMQRQLNQSVPLFQDVLKQRVATLGRQHPETLRTAANLGVNYMDAGRLGEAIPLLEESYRASKQYPTLGWVGAELLEGYALAGKTAEGTALLKELLAEERRSLPPESPQLAGKLARFGAALVTMKAFADAEAILQESLSIRAKKEPEAWTTFNTQSVLGGALLGQKKYAAAEPLLLAGYEGIKKRAKFIPPQNQVRLPEAADRLVELYTATNNPDELKKWQAERARCPKAETSPPPK